eukprot:1535869-Rhodomonas_salina.1
MTSTARAVSTDEVTQKVRAATSRAPHDFQMPSSPPESPMQSPLARRMSEEGEEAMHGRRGLCIRDKVGLPKKEAADVDSDEERVHDTESEVKQMLAELEEEAAALQRDNEVESLSPRRRQK